MKKKRIHFFLVLTLVCLILLSACNNGKNSKEKFETEVNNIISALEKYEEKIKFEYKYFSIENGTINDWFGFEYDISDYNINDGIIAKNSDGDIYLSVENEEYCAIKDFGTDEAIIYPIKEKSNCHKTHITGENLKTFISGKNNQGKNDYNFGDISKNNVVLLVNTNLIDSSNCSYKWYRNGLELDNLNSKRYEIDLSYDDAFYSVEVTTPEGLSVKSESVHVVITK